MDPSNIANLVVDLSIRYSFQVLAALAILAAGFVCARIVGRQDAGAGGGHREPGGRRGPDRPAAMVQGEDY